MDFEIKMWACAFLIENYYIGSQHTHFSKQNSPEFSIFSHFPYLTTAARIISTANWTTASSATV